MTQLKTFSVLIVDRTARFGSDLRARLAPLGVQVHVVGSRAAALTFAETKKIDVAVLEYAIDGWTLGLCEALRERSVPYVYMATDEESGDRLLRSRDVDGASKVEKTFATWL